MLLPWRRKHNNELLGIEASAEGIALARVTRQGGLQLQSCDYLSRDAAGSLDSALPGFVAALGLAHSPCNWVLGNGNYSLLLVEAPNVPAEELREAMRWRIKDLISFPPDQATLDLFELPADGTRGKKMLYVVVAEQQRLRDTVELAQRAKITLKTIDIAEMALRNIAELVSTDPRGLALVRLRPGAGSLALVRQDRLYLSRQFDLDYQAGLFDPLPEEALVLELQRSLDYYERQMGQEPPGRIVFCGDNISADKITDSMRSSLPGEVSFLDLASLLPGAERCDAHVLQLCLGAIGAALRQEVA